MKSWLHSNPESAKLIIYGVCSNVTPMDTAYGVPGRTDGGLHFCRSMRATSRIDRQLNHSVSVVNSKMSSRPSMCELFSV